MHPKTKKILLISSIAVGVLGVAGLVFWLIRRSKTTSKNNILKSNKILVCSHITSTDTSERSKAENNLRNIAILLNNDIDMIEMDVQITKDGVPVLFHDSTLESKTNSSGKIQSKTWNELANVRYNSDSSQGIAKLEDAIGLLKKSGKKTIFQLDKCDASEISKINNLGLFKGVENQILAKSTSFKKSEAVISSGIMYMPIIPSEYVGKMNTDSVIDEIVEKTKGSDFLEAQFSDSDSKLIDGTLASKLQSIGCRLLVVAVGGTKLTNGVSFRGDNESAWSKMISPMKAGVIMTNHPIKLKNFLKSENV